MNRRVVITGLGLVTPLGIGVEETWQALCAGKSGVGEITRFDVTGHNTKIAGEVKDFNAHDFLPKKEARRVDRFIQNGTANAMITGGVEAVFSALSVYHDIMPPTINYENQADECDLDYVPNTARKAPVNIAMTNSFGFGGTNATLLLAKYG